MTTDSFTNLFIWRREKCKNIVINAYVRNPLVPSPLQVQKGTKTGPATLSSRPHELFLHFATGMVPSPPDSQGQLPSPLGWMPCPFLPLCYCKQSSEDLTLGELLGPVELSQRSVFCLLQHYITPPFLPSSSPIKGAECDTISILTRLQDLMWKDWVVQRLSPVTLGHGDLEREVTVRYGHKRSTQTEEISDFLEQERLP